MSNDSAPPPGDPSGPEHRPNWGSAYPPPGSQYPPPGAGYPPPGGQYAYPSYPVQPKHPSATTAMVLGIVSVAGGFLCWLPFFIAPFAWWTGSKAVKEIDAGHGTQAGRGEAMAGKILGIVGTVLLALALAFVILLIVLTFTVYDFWDDEY